MFKQLFTKFFKKKALSPKPVRTPPHSGSGITSSRTRRKAGKRQSFEEATKSTFEQYAEALQRLAEDD